MQHFALRLLSLLTLLLATLPAMAEHYTCYWTRPGTGTPDPIRYLRKFDDCEWKEKMQMDQIPKSLIIYHK